MKITYTPNPLNTIVELDEHEIETLRLKIKLEEYETLIFSAHYHLQDGKFYNPDKARDELDPDYWCNDKSDLNERVDELLLHYLEELKGTHVGDCTCVPCSCSKCHAESLIGIDTIKGLSKHPGYNIYAAFSYKDGDEWKQRTIDEALESLRTYDPKPTSDSGWDKVVGWALHVPRWNSEARVAYEWLLEYKNTKLSLT